MITLDRILTGVMAAGVVLAGVVGWRIRPIRRERWIIAGVTAYGAIAFVHAAVMGVRLRSVFSGDGLFQPLPYMLQGAIIGGLVLLPLGWIASMVRAGVPGLRQGAPRSNLYQALALTTCIVVVVATFPYERPARHGSAGGELQARVADLDKSLKALEDGERDSPRDRWDPDYVVSMVGRGPQQLFAWVQDNTSWIPYRGVLRGPVGVLMDRQGNSLDRALLLATLLEKAGHSVRLAHGELKREEAAKILSGLVARRATVFDVPAETNAPARAASQVDVHGGVAPQPEINRIAAQYQLDSTGVLQTINVQEKAIARVQMDLAARVTEQTSRLLKTVTRPDRAQDWNKRLETATTALQDHWWVQWQQGEKWIDLDLLTAARALGVVADTTMPVNAVPAELHHEITLRVVTEQWTRGTRKETAVLQHTLRPATLSGQPIVLQFWPGSWSKDIQADPNGRYGFKAIALAQHQWAVFLKVGRESVAQAVIGDNGVTNERASANPLAALGGAIAHSLGQQDSSDLTAAWIEYEIRVPGDAPRTVRRVVFDLLGPAMRTAGAAPQLPFSDSQRLTRSLALMMQTEVLPVDCRLASEYVAHLAAQALIKNRGLLGGIAAENLSPELETTKQQLAGAAPAASPLLLLAVSRLEWSVAGNHVVVDRPNVLTRHQSLVAAGNDLVVQDAIDIVANEVGVDLAQKDPFAIRLEQGVFDTNAEAFLGGGPAIGNTAEAYAATRDWLAINSDQRPVLAGLAFSDDFRRKVSEDLDNGFMVVAPRSPMQKQSQAFAGWWRIDPRSGDTLGLSTNGWGGSAPEGVSLVTMAANAIAGFTFEYALCQGISQAVNGVKVLNEEYFGGWHPSWTMGAARSEDPTKIFNDNHKACLIQGIVAGFAVTLPLVMITMKARQARMAAELAEKVAAKEAAAEELEKRIAEWDKALELPKGPPAKTLVDARTPTQVGVGDTIIPDVRRVLRRDPASLLERERMIEAVKTDIHRMQQGLNQTMKDLLEYGRGRPNGLLPSPTYDPLVEVTLNRRAFQEYGDYNKAVDKLIELDPSAGGGGTGGRPNLGPPAQPVGNSNVTLPGQQQAVGAAGANNALGKGSSL